MRRLRELRKEKRLSQLNLAVKLEASQQTISRLEKEEDLYPTGDLLIRMARYFNVSADYLLELTDTRHKNRYNTQKKGSRTYEIVVEHCKNMDAKQLKLMQSIAESFNKTK